MPDLSARELKTLLQARCPGLLFELIPGLRREGNIYSAPNPTRSVDNHGSFKVKPSGAWVEYDEPDDTGKGDVLGLLAYLAGMAPKSREGRRHSFVEAKRILGLDARTTLELRGVRRSLQADAARRREKTDAEEAERARRHFVRSTEIWKGAAIGGDVLARDNLVNLYLWSRGIDIAAVRNRAPLLRLHPGLDHWALPHRRAWRGPAMVAAVCNVTARTAVHCTFLADDGNGRPSKETMPNAKLMLGQVKGCVAPITYGASGLTVTEALARGVRGPVILAEGIETALSLAIAAPEARVWACLSLGNMGNAPVGLDCVSAVFVALENDVKPQAIAQREHVLDRLAACGKPLETLAPHQGNDFADMVKDETHE